MRPQVAPETLLAGTCLYFVAICNAAFWQSAVHDGASPGLLASLAVAVFALHALLLGVFAIGPMLRPLLAVLVVATAVGTFYMRHYAVLFDVEMMLNVLHTDPAESREMLSPWLVLHVLLQAGPPLLVLAWVRIASRPWRQACAARALFLGAMALLATLAVLLSSQGIFALMRSDHALRYRITPGNLVVSTVRALTQAPDPPAGQRLTVAADAARAMRAPGEKPRLLVLVIGETVRAQNWGLNGYRRQTTPELARREVVNFSNVEACGTSTEVSLPCMFSPYGRRHYDKAAIRAHESLLDVLARAGVQVRWRDNQSGCKGVCDGTGIERMQPTDAPTLCNGDRCLDDILLSGLRARIDAVPGDLVVVLHQLGNHGPNYFERYPPAHDVFKPACHTAELSRCTPEQIANAYDNAIRYTDAFLGRALDIVQQQDSHDAALLYVSDHGESLGEYGLYLHGAPYPIAPAQQLRVPMVAWVSSGLAGDLGLDLQCLRARATQPTSHDALFHLVLGAFDVRTQAYAADLDLFAPCRHGTHPVT
ncbi:phosphoethanolamine--lipid A transferase [Luteimonas sp. TWI662]|uniref:phosphoethanolamine transferase n=1 Tax=Luteimonas sp. TWI662 TaxID=3136789 RepID=UPI0032093E2D